jgi:hypothetical protein
LGGEKFTLDLCESKSFKIWAHHYIFSNYSNGIDVTHGDLRLLRTMLFNEHDHMSSCSKKTGNFISTIICRYMTPKTTPSNFEVTEGGQIVLKRVPYSEFINPTSRVLAWVVDNSDLKLLYCGGDGITIVRYATKYPCKTQQDIQREDVKRIIGLVVHQQAKMVKENRDREEVGEEHISSFNSSCRVLFSLMKGITNANSISLSMIGLGLLNNNNMFMSSESFIAFPVLQFARALRNMSYDYKLEKLEKTGDDIPIDESDDEAQEDGEKVKKTSYYCSSVVQDYLLRPAIYEQFSPLAFVMGTEKVRIASNKVLHSDEKFKKGHPARLRKYLKLKKHIFIPEMKTYLRKPLQEKPLYHHFNLGEIGDAQTLDLSSSDLCVHCGGIRINSWYMEYVKSFGLDEEHEDMDIEIAQPNPSSPTSTVMDAQSTNSVDGEFLHGGLDDNDERSCYDSEEEDIVNDTGISVFEGLDDCDRFGLILCSIVGVWRESTWTNCPGDDWWGRGNQAALNAPKPEQNFVYHCMLLHSNRDIRTFERSRLEEQKEVEEDALTKGINVNENSISNVEDNISDNGGENNELVDNNNDDAQLLVTMEELDQTKQKPVLFGKEMNHLAILPIVVDNNTSILTSSINETSKNVLDLYERYKNGEITIVNNDNKDNTNFNNATIQATIQITTTTNTTLSTLIHKYDLKESQRLALIFIVDHVIQDNPNLNFMKDIAYDTENNNDNILLLEEENKQFLIIIGGQAGVGKTTLINALKEFFSAIGNYSNNKLCLFAPIGPAAALIEGKTVASLIGQRWGKRDLEYELNTFKKHIHDPTNTY